MSETSGDQAPGAGPSPQLQLAPAPGPLARSAASPAPSGGRSLVFLVLLLNLGILVLLLLRPGGGSSAGAESESAASGSALTGDDALALRLEERSLWSEAAAEWRAVARGQADAGKRAKFMYRAGTLFEKAGDAEKAAASYVAAERDLKQGGDDNLKHQIGLRLVDCLGKLGRSGEVGRELRRRTTGAEAGEAEVLARIDGEPVTTADLDRLVEGQVDAMLGGRMDAQAREQLLSELRAPRHREEILNQLLQQEVLVRRARELGLDRDDAFLGRMSQVERMLLERAVLEKEIGARLVATPEDLKNYYAGHKSEFTGPSNAKLLLIECASAKDALDLAAKLKEAGEPAFREAAKASSIHEATKKDGGALSTSYQQGGSLLGLPNSVDLDAFVFGEPTGRVSAPMQVEGRHFLFLVQSREIDPVRPFEQAAEQVRARCLQTRQRELSDELVRDLRARYRVILEGDSRGRGPEPEKAPAQK
ncbi:MAG: peptidyl-prolyl cis-trans isomerase [Planctomycetes bacterium]|nr:peptidyl-prolyl cis-trans isomerase [Planctomycetota bacterium]